MAIRAPLALLALLAACAEPPSDGASTVGFQDSGASSPDGTDGAGTDGTDGSDGTDGTGGTEPPAEVVPLYDATTTLDPEIVYDRGDAIVTKFADRGRDRHAREDQFQSYDHYLPHYWKHRTARFLFADTVTKGGSTIEISFVTEWKLSVAEFRAWYYGMGTVAHYHGNYSPRFEETGPGTFDNDHVQVSDEGDQYRYTYTLDHAVELNGAVVPLAVGQFMEIEVSQFLDGVPEGRANYYGTTFLYEVGAGGLVPWTTVGDFDDKASEREDSVPLDETAWLGGRTTLHEAVSDEPDNHFMQMATNLSSVNGQPFVRGRRVHHTKFTDGTHDESAENGVFSEMVGLAGPNYMEASCDGCHHRNGRAAIEPEGETLHHWVFRIGDESGNPDPARGRILQSQGTAGATGEGDAWIAEWVEEDGLRRPVFGFTNEPAAVSARVAPQLVGMGLIEAISEDDVLAWEDPSDADGDGISGRANRVTDPRTGELRLGRFGWKAATSSVAHQTASALNGDMGVMTSWYPTPDCGTEQTDCGNTDGAELSDEHLDDLVRYVSLLGIRPRRSHDDPTVMEGEALFDELGCASCHRPTYETSPYHPLSELRSQTIHPYTDLLLHDMGDGLADTLLEGDVSTSEWRTPPLWGIGNGACVTGGVTGPFQSQVCAPSESYLHDGRARTLTEAILWHGGEAASAQEAFVGLSADEQSAVVAFLQSL